MTFALAIEKLCVMRGGRLVLPGLSRQVAAGTVLFLEGPNGAGKTTLLRALAGFLIPYSGAIHCDYQGKRFSEGEERGKLAGWLGHHDAIKAQLSVREQAAFWAKVYGAPSGAKADVEAALVRFGLGALAEARGQVLSAGQRRRLALARLVLSGRPLWLLDEPTAALDTAGKKLVAEAIVEQAAAGGIVIAATHEPLGVDGEHLVLGGA